jgi:membrane protein DedA with SNARE-associated domain
MTTSPWWRALFRGKIGCVICLAVSLSAAQIFPSIPAAADENTPEKTATDGTPALRHFRGTLARVHPLLMRYGYWAAAVAVLAEGFGIPMPGQTLLIAGSVEAAEGRMNIGWLLLVVVAAAALGNSLGYAIGYWAGRVVLNKLKVNPQRQQGLEQLFSRRGGFVILFGRFVDGLRQLNGIVSGIMKMPWWSFTAYNVAGALLWTGSWGLGSYYLGRRIHGIAAFFHHHHALLLVLGLVTLLALLLYLPRSMRRKENILT